VLYSLSGTFTRLVLKMATYVAGVAGIVDSMVYYTTLVLSLPCIPCAYV